MNKHILKSLCILFLVCLFTQTITAQSPKREMRATWLTTVWGIDWPSTQVVPATGSNDATRAQQIIAQKNQLIAILDSLKQCRMNAVFFQVRGFSDAYYQSAYEPWGQYLSGTRGSYPGYDPLAFAIEQAHARGIELHAWLNPYRYSSSADNYGNLATDYSRTNPGWLLDYGGSTVILNPALPEVRQRIKAVVGDIIANYDVDGIVFDDYFYAYGGTPNTLDSAAQRLYKPATMSIGDWRRWNINKMIEGVYDTIQQTKPYVTFGVSPFGTWTTDEQVAADRGIILPAGVGQTGDMYSSIYCDPLAWLEEGTVDYVSPQIYWTTTSSYPYGKLAPWWADLCNRYGRHFFSSHSVSALTGAPALTREYTELSRSTLEQGELPTIQKGTAATHFGASEIGLQVDINRQGDMNDGPGSVFYNTTKTVKTNRFVNYLRNTVFTQQALVPEIYWKPAPQLPMVSNLMLNGNTLSWTQVNSLAKYAIYAIPVANRNDSDIFTNSNYLLGITYQTNYTLPANINAGTHSIAVTVLDRYNHEYTPRFFNEDLATTSAPQPIYPINGANSLLPCSFRWSTVEDATKYIWQLSEDINFSNLTAARETTDTFFLSTIQTNIQDSRTYYWRVKSIVPNAENLWSDTASFVSTLFGLITPMNGAADVTLTPYVEWQEVIGKNNYVLQISKNVKFAANHIVYTDTLTRNSTTIPANILESYTIYYARVIVDHPDFVSTSTTSMFTTEEVVISIPEIIFPADQSQLEGDTITMIWAEQLANGFTAELSKLINFPPRNTTTVVNKPGNYTARFEALDEGTYYLRVKAQTKDAWTDPSEVVTVHLNAKSGISIDFATQNGFYIVDANGVITLHCKGTAHTALRLEILSETGATVGQYQVEHLAEGTPFVIQTTGLPAGNYIIRINSGDQNSILKFTKKR